MRTASHGAFRKSMQSHRSIGEKSQIDAASNSEPPYNRRVHPDRRLNNISVDWIPY